MTMTKTQAAQQQSGQIAQSESRVNPLAKMGGFSFVQR